MRNLQRAKDLVFWKSTYITWRNVVERAKDPSPIIKFRNIAKRVVQRIEAKILVCLVLGLLFIGGCLENTTTGLGRFIQGGGEFVSGIGKDVIRGSVGYGNER